MFPRGIALAMLILFTCLGLGACGEIKRPTAATASVTGDLEPATARGLAVGVLAHLDTDQVTRIGGTTTGESVSVTIETADPAVESVALFIQPAEAQAGHQCGMESTYTTVTCETEPHLIEIGVRKSSKGRMPRLMGRCIEESRGSVLVQIWAPDTEQARQLVRDLLADPLLGRQTSRSLNDEGERLPDFNVDKFLVEFRDGGRGHVP